jgi:hypothetical protein
VAFCEKVVEHGKGKSSPRAERGVSLTQEFEGQLKDEERLDKAMLEKIR